MLKDNKGITATMDIETVLTEDIGQTKQNGTKIPYTELAALGGGFSTLAESFRTITSSVEYAGEPLYRAVIPEGIIGTILKFKDEDALTGMIHNKADGLVANVRWKEASDLSGVQTTAMPYDPTMMFMAMALISIDKKLDKIQEMQEEIIDFLKRDKESKIVGSVNSLYEVLSQYKYNWDNDKFISAKLNLVQSIKKEAKENEVFYRKEIDGIKGKVKKIHMTINAKKLAGNIRKSFQDYKLSLYMYSFASFIETMLLENFSKDYIDSVVKSIRDYDDRFKELLREYRELIEKQMAGSIDAMVAKGVSKANLKVGGAIEKTPVISKGPIDELMIGIGSRIEDSQKKKAEKQFNGFFSSETCDPAQFAEQLEKLRDGYNEPSEFLLDGENLYITR